MQQQFEHINVLFGYIKDYMDIRDVVIGQKGWICVKSWDGLLLLVKSRELFR